MTFLDNIHRIADGLGRIADTLALLLKEITRLADAYTKHDAVGIGVGVKESSVTSSPVSQLGVSPMATKFKCVTMDSLKGKGAGAPMKKGAAAPGDFMLAIDKNGLFTVFGVDIGGNHVDISGVAKLDPPPTSSDTSKLTLDMPSGMTFLGHPATNAAGSHVDVSVTATWNDGSVGPFTGSVPLDITTGGPTGIQIVPSVAP